MKRIDCGTSGQSSVPIAARWEDLSLPQPWPEVITALCDGQNLREVQRIAISDLRILESRRNLIVSAPTNAGKSLVGTLFLLEAAMRGKRSILIEPLRAIAREKVEELERALPALSNALNRKLRIQISTGDYRVENGFFSSPPPTEGELIVATPERLDAILINPSYDEWVSSVQAVCVDEAHLISSPRRGAALENVITTLLCRSVPPRMALMSGSIGDVELAQGWLTPCDLVSVVRRFPELRKEVIELAQGEDASEVVIRLAGEVLADPTSNLLVFVYQQRSAERLSEKLSTELPNLMGPSGALAYHAKMSQERRDSVRKAFADGSSHCIVTTTALGLGVNLPATHVIIRDNTFAGVGRLAAADILQMMGRAGRGDRQGRAAVIVRPEDGWTATELAAAVREEILPALTSYAVRIADTSFDGEWGDQEQDDGVIRQVAAQLSRRDAEGLTFDELKQFFERSLGGKALVARVKYALSWLDDCERHLVHKDASGRYRLTSLGLAAVRATLPLGVAAGFAQLIRDLLIVDPEDEQLSCWGALDHLISLGLLSERSPSLRHFSASLVVLVDAWADSNPRQMSLLFSKWIKGGAAESRAAELFGSLGLEARKGNKKEGARRAAYLAVLNSIVLYERGYGKSVEELARDWAVKGLEGVEERWRDDFIWLLSGLASLLDLRCFYFHLKEVCNADSARISRVKHLLGIMRGQVYDLMSHIKYCSPLGGLIRNIKEASEGVSGAKIGVRSIRHLEEAGIRSHGDLEILGIDELTGIGLRRDVAEKIRDYFEREGGA